MSRGAAGDGELTRAAAPRLRHVDALDGVRGLAVCAVLLFHAGYLQGGYLGVDLFFTLSGFLITRLILDDLVRDRFSLRAFWGRRARRLLPAAWVLIAAVLLAGPVLVRTTELASLRGDALATLGYVANWWQVATSSSYFAVYESPSPLQHTWSLAIEEQLYVLWPLLLIVLWRFGRRRLGVLAAAAAALAAASVVLGDLLYKSADAGNRVYYGTDTRAASVLIGAVAAMIVWRFGDVVARSRLGGAVAWFAAAVIGLYWIRGGNGAWLYRGGLAMLAVAGASVLMVVTTQPGSRLRRTLSTQPLVAVGVISYGVYLYHFPLFLWLSPDRTGLDGVALLSVRVATTFAAATASYFFIERPYRRRQWAFSLRTAGAFAAAGLIVFAALALPVPHRLDRRQSAAAVEKLEVRGASATATATAPQLVLPATVRPPQRLLVLGDSVGELLDEGFADAAPPNVIVADAATRYCGIGDDFPQMKFGVSIIQDRCSEWRTEWPERAAQMHADGVLLVFGIQTSTRFIDGDWREACDPVYDAWHQRVFTDAVRTMEQFGPVWIALAAYNRAESRFGTTLADRDAQTDCTNRNYRAAVAAAGPNAGVIDLAGFICPPSAGCIEDVDGVALRPDGLHYEGPGADIVAAWLLAQVGVRFQPTG
jgi:peptidoglycan/LPS O-acetylase OafA/YrhL